MKVYLAVMCSIAFVLVTFGQGCSKVGFTDPPIDLASIASNSKMKIEDGAAYTNKQVVKVTFNNIPPEYDFVRAGMTSDLSAVTWLPYASEMHVDMAAEFAPDGSKDGIKTIFVEFKNSLNQTVFSTQASIGLDRVPPQISLKGLLANGMQGKAYTLNQLVPIQWSAEDVSKAGVNFSSGLHASNALSVKYGKNADCTEDIVNNPMTQVMPWGSFTTDLTNFKWPTNSPLEAFFVCVYVQDKAGNVATALSQPLVSYYKILAVDNSQGNGGSVRAGNVRFGDPRFVGKDSSNNIYIGDIAFRNIRIVDRRQNINLYAGNGTTDCPVDGKPALDSGLGNLHYMVVDAQDRVVFGSCNDLWRVEKDATGVRRMKSLKVTQMNSATVLHFDREGKYLYINSVVNALYSDPASGMYLFRIPVEDLGKTNLNLAALKAKYILVGNGMTPNMDRHLTAPYTPPATVILSNSDPLDFDHTVGRISAITTSPDGRIFFATSEESNGRALGNNTVRELKPLGDGKYLQTILQSGPSSTWLEYVTAAADDEYLLMAQGTFIGRFAFKSPTGKLGLTRNVLFPGLTAPTTTRDRKQSMTILKNSAGAPEQLVAAQAYNSKLLVYSSAFAPLEAWGRDLRDVVGGTTSTVLSDPTGIAADSSGTIFIVDTMNSLLKVIDPVTGIINNFGGGYGPDKVLASAPLTDLTYNGEPILGGHDTYHFNVLEAGSERTLFFSSFKTKSLINEINLVTQRVTTIGTTGDRNCADPRTWEPAAMASRMEDGVKTVYVLRNWPYYTDLDTNCVGTGVAGRAGVITKIQGGTETIIAGQNVYKLDQRSSAWVEGTSVANLQLMNARGLELDSKGNLYFMLNAPGNSGALHSINVNDLSKPPLTVKGVRNGFSKFTIIEKGSRRHVFVGATGEIGYYNVDVNDLSMPYTYNRLCLPGTNLSALGDMNKTADGRLLINDKDNQRALEYITMKDGAVTLNFCD